MSASSLNWVARLPAIDAVRLGSLRTVRGLRIFPDSDVLWLTGDEFDEKFECVLRSIPNLERFRLWPDRQLTRWNETVPCARLPAGDWQPLIEWMMPKLPIAGFAAMGHVTEPLKLVRCSTFSASNVWCANWQAWRDYAVTAPNVRLSRWSFAVSENWKVLIRGIPVPLVPGFGYVDQEGIAIPSGWRFDPEIPAAMVRKILKLDDTSTALFASDGSFERIPESAFVRANRSAVRFTDA